MIRSAILKDAGFSWLRFEKQMNYVATECGQWNADLLAASTEKSIELEIKISVSDLRAEFRKPKHQHYLSAEDARPKGWKRHRWSVPNLFLFLVPAPLVAEADALAEAHNPNYGVLSYDWEAPVGERIRSFRKAQRLHGEPPTQELFQTIAKRMASDLATHYFLAARHQEFITDLRAEMRTMVETSATAVTQEEHR